MNETTKKSSNVATILWLVFFFPVGLYFLWAKTNWNKKIKWIISGVFAFFVLVGVIDNATGSKNTSTDGQVKVQPVNTQTSTPSQPTLTPTVSVPLTLDQQVKNVLPSSLSDTSVEIDDAVDFKTDEKVSGMKDITITGNHKGDYWDVNDTKQETWKEAIEIMQKIFLLDNTINGLTIINEVPVTDAYGKDKTSMLTTISISRDTYTKINFSNFNYKNIPVIADSYVENHTIK